MALDNKEGRMSYGYSGFSRANRYDDAYFQAVAADNAATAELRASVPEISAATKGALPPEALIKAGHFEVLEGSLFALEGSRDVYRHVTVRVTHDSPICKRVMGYAKEIVLAWRNEQGFDQARVDVLMGQIDKFLAPFCGLTAYNLTAVASDMLDMGGDEVRSYVVERAFRHA